jgi:arylsulfatase A-like enzyme
MRKHQFLGVVIAAVGICGGCGAKDTPERAMPLHQLAESAEVLAEVSVLDLGTESSRSHLLAGWSFDERDSQMRTFVWSNGPESTLELFVAEPANLCLELLCRPFTFPNSPTQTVELVVNGVAAETITLEAGFQTISTVIPAGLLVAGVNSISFRYGYSRRVSDVQPSRDQRQLGVAWDEVRFIGLHDQVTVSIDRDVTLSPGTDVGFFIADWRRVVIDRVDGRSCSDCQIHIMVRGDGDREQELAVLSADTGASVIAIPDTAAPLRLGFRCTGSNAGSLTLGAPTLYGPEPGHHVTQPLRPDPGHRRPNILVYLVDALRSDRLGCYGSKLGLSPRIDAMAEKSWVFDAAVAQCSWTKPSVASLFTGLPPVEHSVNDKGHRLPDEVETIAELFAQAGYQTAGFSTNAYVSRSQGFAQGFESFEYAPASSREVTQWVAEWLTQYSADERPFFLYVHTVDPHAPYEPTPDFRRRFAPDVSDPRIGGLPSLEAMSRGEVPITPQVIADLMSLYNAEVAENDAAFGDLMDVLEASRRIENTLVVFLSDHGEEFNEHRALGHGMDLHQEVLSVPLVLHIPSQVKPRRLSMPVQHIDLVPTLMEAAGVPMTRRLEGRSLFSVASATWYEDRRIYSYLDLDGRRGIASTTARWKLILPLGGMGFRGPALYYRRNDPTERRDVASEHSVLAGYEATCARSALARMERHAVVSEAGTLDPAERRDLEALGYVD